MFFVCNSGLAPIKRLELQCFNGLLLNRLLNNNYNNRNYDIFFGVGDLISLEVLRFEAKFKSNLNHVTIHHYIGGCWLSIIVD